MIFCQCRVLSELDLQEYRFDQFCFVPFYYIFVESMAFQFCRMCMLTFSTTRDDDRLNSLINQPGFKRRQHFLISLMRFLFHVFALASALVAVIACESECQVGVCDAFTARYLPVVHKSLQILVSSLPTSSTDFMYLENAGERDGNRTPPSTMLPEALAHRPLSRPRDVQPDCTPIHLPIRLQVLPRQVSGLEGHRAARVSGSRLPYRVRHVGLALQTLFDAGGDGPPKRCWSSGDALAAPRCCRQSGRDDREAHSQVSPSTAHIAWRGEKECEAYLWDLPASLASALRCESQQMQMGKADEKKYFRVPLSVFSGL